VTLPKTHQAPNAFEERDHASIQALFVTDPADDMQMIANKKDKLLDTTDNWILNNSTYLKWLKEECSRVLWLHGDPGKGKTMLAISLIEGFSKNIQLAEAASSEALITSSATTKMTGGRRLLLFFEDLSTRFSVSDQTLQSTCTMNTSGKANSCSPRQTHYRHCGEFFTPSLNIPVSKESLSLSMHLMKVTRNLWIRFSCSLSLTLPPKTMTLGKA